MTTNPQPPQPVRYVDESQFDMPYRHILAEGNASHVVTVKLQTQENLVTDEKAEFIRAECLYPGCNWWQDLV